MISLLVQCEKWVPTFAFFDISIGYVINDDGVTASYHGRVTNIIDGLSIGNIFIGVANKPASGLPLSPEFFYDGIVAIANHACIIYDNHIWSEFIHKRRHHILFNVDYNGQYISASRVKINFESLEITSSCCECFCA